MRRFSVLLKLSFCVVLVGCSTERAAPPPSPAPVVPAAPATQAPETSQAPVVSKSASMPDMLEADGRDPFQTAMPVPVKPPKTADVLPRKSKRFGVDELKLIGIVSTPESPRAMLVDPRGKGWVVTRGELLGRAEVLHDSEGDHAVSWRVDRIRESEVVLVREDANHSVAVPSSTRVLALHHAPVNADDAELDD